MIYETDPYLAPYKEAIEARHARIEAERDKIAVDGSLSKGLNNHLFYGLHREADGNWIFREWAPNASRIYLIGEFNNWKRTSAYALQPTGGGNWEIRLPSMFLHHGTLLLAFRFVPEYGVSGGLVKSVFHAVSAFCNAGFDILGRGNSLSDYAADPYLSIVISLLVIVGGLGFFVWRDLWMCLRGKGRLSPYSKLVLWATGSLLVLGTVLLFAFENENPAFDAYSRPKLLLTSFFQSAVTRTAGFYSIPLSELSSTSKAVSMVLMFIGGASGSTAGGIKVGTFAVILIAMAAIIRGHNNFVFAGRRISLNNVLRAMGILSVAIAVVSTSTLVICLIEPELYFADVLYEVISAFATVGQTLGITPDLSVISKGIIVLLMFFGRVGIITVTYAIMFNQARSENLITYPETNVLLG